MFGINAYLLNGTNKFWSCVDEDLMISCVQSLLAAMDVESVCVTNGFTGEVIFTAYPDERFIVWEEN